MKNQKKAEDIAAERVQLLSPLLAEGLDAAKLRDLRKEICKQTGLSERTIRRLLSAVSSRWVQWIASEGQGACIDECDHPRDYRSSHSLATGSA